MVATTWLLSCLLGPKRQEEAASGTGGPPFVERSGGNGGGSLGRAESWGGQEVPHDMIQNG